MPRIGMEPLRRQALIDATIGAIGARGSLDVTMQDIAGRAGVSPALAHHYFGAKDDLLEATLRHLLDELAAEARAALREAGTDGRARVLAIIGVNLSGRQFDPATVTAWLAFYGEANHSPPVLRLLSIYARRLRSNLVSGLALLLPRARAEEAAEILAALIDGLYLRRAIHAGSPAHEAAIALARHTFDAILCGAAR